MTDPQNMLGKVIEYLLAGVLGWVVASFSFQRRLDEFERRIVGPVRDRVSKFEGAAAFFVTREELKAEITSLKTDFKDAVGELKSLIRELRTER
jgi:hypothetical protein